LKPRTKCLKFGKKQFKALKNLRKQGPGNFENYFPPTIIAGLKCQCATRILNAMQKQAGKTGNERGRY